MARKFYSKLKFYVFPSPYFWLFPFSTFRPFFLVDKFLWYIPFFRRPHHNSPFQCKFLFMFNPHISFWNNYAEEEGSQYKYKLKNPRRASVHPRLKPMAPIHPADKIHTHHHPWHHRTIFSDAVMDGARDFYLLGKSVPQVRASACTLALLGFFNLE